MGWFTARVVDDNRHAPVPCWQAQSGWKHGGNGRVASRCRSCDAPSQTVPATPRRQAAAAGCRTSTPCCGGGATATSAKRASQPRTFVLPFSYQPDEVLSVPSRDCPALWSGEGRADRGENTKRSKCGQSCARRAGASGKGERTLPACRARHPAGHIPGSPSHKESSLFAGCQMHPARMPAAARWKRALPFPLRFLRLSSTRCLAPPKCRTGSKNPKFPQFLPLP